MITQEMVLPVGRILKTHSFKGRLKVDIFYEKEIFYNPETPFFIKIDNILVPFFVDSIGGGSDNMSYLKLNDVNTDEEAASLVGKEIFALKSYLSQALGLSEEDLAVEPDDFLGFDVFDTASEDLIGEVVGIEEGVEYDYLSVRRPDSGDLLDIPFIDEFVDEIVEPESDREKGIIRVSLPEGFLDI